MISPSLEQLKCHIEDALQLHMTRHELLLQKCLERLTQLHMLSERENKLGLEYEPKIREEKSREEPTTSLAAASSDDPLREVQLSGLDARQQEIANKVTKDTLGVVQENLTRIEGLLKVALADHADMGVGDAQADDSDTGEGKPTSPFGIDLDMEDRQAGQQEQEGQQSEGTGSRSPRKDESPRVTRVRSGMSARLGLNKSGTVGTDKWYALDSIAEEKPGFGKRCLASIFRLAEWWDALEEPERDGFLARNITESKWFESLCATVILMNAIFTSYTTNWEMKNLGADPTNFMVIGETGFLIFYIVELILKLLVHKWYFFIGSELRWNIFDLFLVLFSIYDQLLSDLGSDGGDGGGVNLTFMRSFRVFKMAKILRAVRAMRFITELRLMLNSIVGSVISLFWSFVMLLFIFYIFSLIFVQGTITYLLDNPEVISSDSHTNISKHFGSVQEAIMSLVKATTGGNDWDVFYETLVLTGTMNAALFIFFIGFFQIALLNVLTGIFVENAMKLAQPDPYTQALNDRKRDLQEAEELKEVCASSLDKNKSGKVSPEDFEKEIHHGRLRAHLRVLGLDIKEPRKFYSILRSASGSDHVDIDSFVAGCMKLKGFATAIDLQSLMCETREVGKAQKEFQKNFNRRIAKIAYSDSTSDGRSPGGSRVDADPNRSNNSQNQNAEEQKFGL